MNTIAARLKSSNPAAIFSILWVMFITAYIFNWINLRSFYSRNNLVL